MPLSKPHTIPINTDLCIRKTKNMTFRIEICRTAMLKANRKRKEMGSLKPKARGAIKITAVQPTNPAKNLDALELRLLYFKRDKFPHHYPQYGVDKI